MMRAVFVYLYEAWDFIDQLIDRIYEYQIVKIDGMYEVRWH